MILTSKKGNAAVWIVVSLALALVMFFLLSGMLRINIKGFQDTITPCSSYNGGICRPEGCIRSADEQWQPAGDRDCKKTPNSPAQCCSSDLIRERLLAGQLPPMSDEITVQVLGKDGNYKSDQEIPITVGEPVILEYAFKTIGDPATFACRFIFVDGNDNILEAVERSGRLYFEKTDVEQTSEVIQANTDRWKPCSDFQAKASIFTMRNYEDGISLRIKKSQGTVMEYQEMNARFLIKLEKPIEGGIMLKVSDKYRDFSQGETIKLFTGRQYNFKAVIVETQKYLEDYPQCSIFIVDESSAEQVGAGVRNSITNKQSTLLRSGENLAVAETNTGCGEEFALNEVRFTQEHEYQNLVLYAIVSDGKAPIAMSKFNLNVEPPLTISGISNDWTNNAKITFECNVPECISISYKIPRTTDPFQQRNDCFTQLQDMKELLVKDGKAELELNKETMPALGLPDKWDTPICLFVWYHPAENSEDRHWAAFYTKNVMIDIEAPTITGINGLNIVCDDNDGSGCDRLYYDILRGTSTNDYNNYRRDGVMTTIISKATEWAAKLALPRNLRCHDPRPIYSDIGVPSYRPNTFGTTYKRTGPLLNTYDDGKSYVQGEVCVYATDSAGNQGKPVAHNFEDVIGAENELLYQIRTEVAQQTGEYSPYYQIADSALPPPQSGG